MIRNLCLDGFRNIGQVAGRAFAVDRTRYLLVLLTVASLSGSCNGGGPTASAGASNVSLGAPGAPAGSPAATINATTQATYTPSQDATAAVGQIFYRHCDAAGCHANQTGAACTAAQALGAACGTQGETCVLNSCGDTLVCGVNDNQVNCKE